MKNLSVFYLEVGGHLDSTLKVAPYESAADNGHT